MKNYVQPGERIAVVLAAAVASKEAFVIGTGLLGIAVIAGAIGDRIDAAVKGVYALPKVSGADITQGQQVLWDASAGAVDDDQATPETGDFLCGYAWASAGVGETTVAVKINERAPAVT